jgi:hypothetical protein
MATTAQSTYRKFIGFEERAAKLYLDLASRFAKDSELSAFWLDMALQEKQHAGLLQFCLRDRLFASNLPDSVEIRKLTSLFERLEKRAAAARLSVKSAFLLAIELECSEINTIYSYLTTTLHKSMYLLRRKITITLPNHVDQLLTAARKFGVSARSMQELSRARERCSGQWEPA